MGMQQQEGAGVGRVAALVAMGRTAPELILSCKLKTWKEKAAMKCGERSQK